MELKKVNEFVNGEKVITVLLVKSIESKIAKNEKPYAQMVLSDQTGNINAKKWDTTPEEAEKFAAGTLVKIEGTIGSYLNELQMTILRMRAVVESDGVSIADYVKTAPIKDTVMLDSIHEFIDRMKNEDIKDLTRAMVEEKREKILYYAAAKGNHHSIKSGLLYHILTMLRVADALSNIYVNINKDLLFAGIILHDLEKINEMDCNEMGIVSDYTFEGVMLGHITMGVKNLEVMARKLGTPTEIIIMLEHMILSHHYQPEFGSPVKPSLPEAELLHRIDMIDARMYDYAEALEDVKPGEFSDRIYTLDRRPVYKPTF